MYPEYRLPRRAEAGLARRPRRAPSSGADLAERFGWKVGDRIPIQGTIWRRRTAARRGSSTSRASTTAEPGVDKTQFFFHYDYLDENRAGGEGLVGWYVVQDRRRRRRRSRWRDASTQMFANSSAETKTTTEKAFVAGLRQADRRHRRDHDRDPGRRVLHDPAGRRQHHGAVGARAHQRAGRAQDAGLLRRRDPGAGARRVAAARRASAAGWACWRRGSSSSGATRPAACCRSSCCPTRDRRRSAPALVVRAGPRRRAAAGRQRRCGCGSPTRCDGR